MRAEIKRGVVLANGERELCLHLQAENEWESIALDAMAHQMQLGGGAGWTSHGSTNALTPRRDEFFSNLILVPPLAREEKSSEDR